MVPGLYVILDPVLMNLLNIDTKQFVVSDDKYLSAKAIMVKLFQAMQYAKCLSLSVAVSSLCPC